MNEQKKELTKEEQLQQQVKKLSNSRENLYNINSEKLELEQIVKEKEEELEILKTYLISLNTGFGRDELEKKIGKKLNSEEVAKQITEIQKQIETNKNAITEKNDLKKQIESEVLLAEKKISKINIGQYKNYNQALLIQSNKAIKERKSDSEHRKSYITVNRFYIEIESEVKASFSECSGLGVNIKKETYLEGGVNDQQRIILGHAEFPDVTLKRGMTDDLTFFGWLSYALTGRPNSRRNVNILLFNQAGETMTSWTLIGAIPIGWKTPGFQADGNSVAIEELTLAYEGLQVKFNQGGGGASVGLGRDFLGFFPSN